MNDVIYINESERYDTHDIRINGKSYLLPNISSHSAKKNVGDKTPTITWTGRLPLLIDLVSMLR